MKYEPARGKTGAGWRASRVSAQLAHLSGTRKAVHDSVQAWEWDSERANRPALT